MADQSQKRLLALDGGGIMGLISLGILREVEDQLRAAHGEDPAFRLRCARTSRRSCRDQPAASGLEPMT